MSKARKPRAMQSIKTRITQLEDLHRCRDEILVVWRKPGAALSKALAKADYGPGDRVVCFEWYGSGDPPEPQWHSDLLDSLSKEERESIDTMCRRALDASPNKGQTAERTAHHNDELHCMSEEELLYILCGVPDGKMFKPS